MKDEGRKRKENQREREKRERKKQSSFFHLFRKKHFLYWQCKKNKNGLIQFIFEYINSIE